MKSNVIPRRSNAAFAACGTSPDPAATSSMERCLALLCCATRCNNRNVVELLPNQRFTRLRSASELWISAGVPASLSSSSGITTRFIQEQIARGFGSYRKLTVKATGRKVNDTRTKRGEGFVRRLYLGQLLFQQLLVVKIRVVAVTGNQLLMRAQFDDAAAVQHRDLVGVAHRRNAMRNEDGRATTHDVAEMV